MKAKANTTYANIAGNIVTWIFTKKDMSEWNENDLNIVEIPKDLLSKVSVGTEYRDNNFIINELIQTNENTTYGVLDSNNRLLYSFTKAQRENYNSNEKVVVIPSIQVLEVKEGDLYNEANSSFELDLEYVKSLYMKLANDSYNGVINIVMGEDTPLTEIVSWETQEREAKAFLETNDLTQASSIAVMAQTQGRDITEFANKIIEKAQNYRTASSFLIGYRQKIIKALESATDIEAIRLAKFDNDYVLQTLKGGANE